MGAGQSRFDLERSFVVLNGFSPPPLRNVFLTTKEVLNNVVKHAKATEVHLRLALTGTGFELTIEDNGCGFSPRPLPVPDGERPARHGLESVQRRIESLGGALSIDSTPGQGTRVVFLVPVNVASR